MTSAAKAAPIRITGAIWLDPDEIHESFVRAAGPGGQHVNKSYTLSLHDALPI